MNKTKSITFRVSEHDKKSIVARARGAKMKTSDFVRYAALGKEVVHIDGLEKLTTQLKYVGNNLNQIATLKNMNIVKNPDVVEMKSRLLRIFDSIEICLNGGDEDSHC